MPHDFLNNTETYVKGSHQVALFSCRQSDNDPHTADPTWPTGACFVCLMILVLIKTTRLILGLCPASERRRYFVTTSLIGWAQA